MTSILGAAIKRREDPRLVTGKGEYADDVRLDGGLHVAFVRSPLSHAAIKSIDTSAAAAMPGVAGVFVASDLNLEPHFGLALYPPDLARPPLAVEKVRFAGEAMAVVVAETAAQAADAAGAVFVDLEPLPALLDPFEAADADPLFEGFPMNVVMQSEFGDDDALDGAEVKVTGRFVNQRVAPVPMEPNIFVAAPDLENGGLNAWASTQIPHRVRDDIAQWLGLDEKQVRVRARDVGGAFGAKLVPYPEQLILAKLAFQLQRPVRWVETRSENFLAMTHGRAQTQEVQLGAKRDGTLVGLDVRVTQDAGAYPGNGGFLPHFTGMMLSGVYRIPKVHYSWRSVLTNTPALGAYRGAGRPEATALIERAMDLLAAELHLDPAELRRRNLIAKDAFPYSTATGATYDSGDYEAALDKALAAAGYDELRAEQSRRRESGERLQLGIGVSTYVEITAGVTPVEYGSVELRPDATFLVGAGTSNHGQGHETSMAQIAAESLGVDMDQVEVVRPDTGLVPRGDGTSGSRSMQLGGSAVLTATRELKERAREAAANLLEAAAEDVEEVEPGRFGVRGSPGRTVGWAELATAGAELRAHADFQQSDPTFPFGTHVAVVEVDLETGHVRHLKQVAVDDCGRVINPMLAAGQVHGGVAQGAAQALFEEVLYASDGNPLTTSLLDYSMPTIAEMPEIVTIESETPTPNNPLGAKGIGESGTIGSLPAVQSAVLDALSHLGIRHLDMPLTPDRVWAAIQASAGR
ncbi:MAG TPA: xanthine dehydrogenase family protein molybdopterin-binding subunit [Candidatus Dormibacteraeota bacterium]